MCLSDIFCKFENSGFKDFDEQCDFWDQAITIKAFHLVKDRVLLMC